MLRQVPKGSIRVQVPRDREWNAKGWDGSSSLMDRVSVAGDEKTLEMEGSDAASGMTYKIVSFVLDVLDMVFHRLKINACRRGVGP